MRDNVRFCANKRIHQRTSASNGPNTRRTSRNLDAAANACAVALLCEDAVWKCGACLPTRLSLAILIVRAQEYAQGKVFYVCISHSLAFHCIVFTHAVLKLLLVLLYARTRSSSSISCMRKLCASASPADFSMPICAA